MAGRHPPVCVNTLGAILDNYYPKYTKILIKIDRAVSEVYDHKRGDMRFLYS